jgi:hypothetical protein
MTSSHWRRTSERRGRERLILFRPRSGDRRCARWRAITPSASSSWLPSSASSGAVVRLAAIVNNTSSMSIFVLPQSIASSAAATNTRRRSSAGPTSSQTPNTGRWISESSAERRVEIRISSERTLAGTIWCAARIRPAAPSGERSSASRMCSGMIWLLPSRIASPSEASSTSLATDSNGSAPALRCSPRGRKGRSSLIALSSVTCTCSSTRGSTESAPAIRPSRRCSVPIDSWFSARAASPAWTTTWRAGALNFSSKTQACHRARDTSRASLDLVVAGSRLRRR